MDGWVELDMHVRANMDAAPVSAATVYILAKNEMLMSLFQVKLD